jgi:hypothetical protein
MTALIIGFMLVAMWLTPATLLTHLLWSLLCLPCVQLLISSTRASPTMRLPCLRGSSELYTGSARRGGDLLGAASSAATPPISSPTAPSGRSLTPPTSTTTITRTTQRQGRGKEEVPLRGQEEEVPEEDVPSVCRPQRPRLL